MRYLVFAWLVVSGCGSVKKEGDPVDAMPASDMAIDMTETCTGDTVVACGASCTQCTTTNDREVPTCDGTSCGYSCVGSAPKCGDNSCSRTSWTFASNMLDGITGRTPAGLAIGVRNFNGEQAIAIDVTSLPPEVSFRIPVCLSGVVDMRALTLSYRVFFQGGTQQNENYYTQASVPSPQTGAYIGQRGVQAGLWVPHSGPLSMSQFSATTSEVTIQLGSYGASFSGTIWVDDIKIE